MAQCNHSYQPYRFQVGGINNCWQTLKPSIHSISMGYYNSWYKYKKPGHYKNTCIRQ